MILQIKAIYQLIKVYETTALIGKANIIALYFLECVPAGTGASKLLSLNIFIVVVKYFGQFNVQYLWGFGYVVGITWSHVSHTLKLLHISKVIMNNKVNFRITTSEVWFVFNFEPPKASIVHLLSLDCILRTETEVIIFAISFGMIIIVTLLI